MRYAGGKNNFAIRLAYIIGSGDVLIEPFIGSGAMTAALAPNFNKVYAYDAHPDLVLMWQALLAGWIPPGEVSKEQFESLRHAHSSPLRGFVGFACSFGGAWFTGYSSHPDHNYADEPKRLL
jgi:DNA adenine methylase